MTTLLEKPLKRELEIGREPYTLTISPDGLKLVPKGKRRGVELKWLDLVSGQAALAVALNASLDRLDAFPPNEPQPLRAPSRAETAAHASARRKK